MAQVVEHLPWVQIPVLPRKKTEMWKKTQKKIKIAILTPRDNQC
jgi:hypothetical protein